MLGVSEPCISTPLGVEQADDGLVDKVAASGYLQGNALQLFVHRFVDFPHAASVDVADQARSQRQVRRVGRQLAQLSADPGRNRTEPAHAA